MNTDKTFADKGTSRAVTEGPISTMEKGSHPTDQMNRTSASRRVPANPIHSSTTTTKDHLFSSEKKTDPNTLDFSPAPTSEEKSNPMNPIAHRYNRDDRCIHKQMEDVAAIEGRSSSNISNPITNVGTEPLASQCLQDDKPANDAHGIETGRDSDRASLLQAGGSCPTFKCLTNCEEEKDILEVERHVPFASAETSKIPHSLQYGEPVDYIDRIDAEKGSNGAAAASAEASKRPRSLQRDEPEPVYNNDCIEASQGSNGDVASYLPGGGSCTELTTADNMVHDFQNISKPLHAAIGATSLIGKDVDENKIAISSTSTDKGTYILLPEEETDTAAGAAKIAPKASAVNDTGGSTKEAAVKEVSTYLLKLHCFFYSVLL